MQGGKDIAAFSAEPYLRMPPGYYDRVFRKGRGVQWFWHRERFKRVEAAIPSDVETVVDLGCGPGTFLGSTARRFRSAVGIDLAPAQIEYARRQYGRPGLEFTVGDVSAMETAQKFDAVVAIEVIEHLAFGETRAFLERALRLLAPGGCLVLTTPNYRSLWPLLERAVSRIGPVDYRAQHINRFTAHRLRRDLSTAGFEGIVSETFFCTAPFWALFGTGLARAVLRVEDRLLPRLGAEILARARRPL